MADEQDVVIKIDPDAAPTGDQTVTGDAAVKDLQQQYTALQAKATQTEQRATDAERRASTAEQERNRLAQEVVTAKASTVDSEIETTAAGIDAAQSGLKAARSAYKLAMESGDFEKAAEAQEQMAVTAGELAILKQSKAMLEDRKDEATKAPKAPPPQHADPVEAYVANRTAPTATWLRQHPDYITDQRKNSKLTAAHYDAVGEGLSPDTPEYFSYVETYLGLKMAEQSQQNAPKAPTPQRATPVVAPVGQANGGSVNGGAVEVRLSASEARAAQDGTLVWNYDDTSPQKRFKKGDPIGVQEFARRKAQMTKDGVYDRTYVSQ